MAFQETWKGFLLAVGRVCRMKLEQEPYILPERSSGLLNHLIEQATGKMAMKHVENALKSIRNVDPRSAKLPRTEEYLAEEMNLFVTAFSTDGEDPSTAILNLRLAQAETILESLKDAVLKDVPKWLQSVLKTVKEIVNLIRP